MWYVQMPAFLNYLQLQFHSGGLIKHGPRIVSIILICNCEIQPSHRGLTSAGFSLRSNPPQCTIKVVCNVFSPKKKKKKLSVMQPLATVGLMLQLSLGTGEGH